MASKAPAKKAKDLAPKSGNVKGGRMGWTTNDNLTFVRAAKPTPKRKDLSSRKEIKGGGKRLNDNTTLVRAAKPTPKQKDLPAKPSTVKGGGWTQNDNTTLVRAAKAGKTLVRNATPAPKKRDLPSRKDVKGGKKRT
jgi:hypothetical protein